MAHREQLCLEVRCQIALRCSPCAPRVFELGAPHLARRAVALRLLRAEQRRLAQPPHRLRRLRHREAGRACGGGNVQGFAHRLSPGALWLDARALHAEHCARGGSERTAHERHASHREGRGRLAVGRQASEAAGLGRPGPEQATVLPSV